MNNTNQNHTDNFFKQGLESPPEFNPSEKNWKEMERLLKPEAKRGGMAWIYPVSGIAAALLVFLSLWLVPDKTDTENQQPQIVKAQDEVKEAEGQTNSNLNSVKPGDTDASSAGSPSAVVAKISFESLRGTALLSRNSRKNNSNQVSSPSTDLFITDQPSLSSSLTDTRYATIQTSSAVMFASQRNIEKSTASANIVETAVTKPKSPEIQTNIIPGKWALSLGVSPDVNSVKGIDNGDMGMSMGMGVSYRLGKVLSVGTGVYYSKKLYSADKTSYKVTEKPFATWTSYSKQIEADCRVIDVPVNLSLRLSDKTQNKLYATAGMSSYIMLSEKYDFIYNNPSPAFPTGRREYTVRNENKHLLSVVNLGVALERPLSDQVSLVIQPYAKLPLTGIGQGETDLKSFGVGFKLNYSLKKK
ncbi:hypothetical protein [Daejeonella sp.]|uniref:hypothetical protein n=1 Tax=Daejeonella sp. TaxID=2805397 RepID=UPI0030C649E9